MIGLSHKLQQTLATVLLATVVACSGTGDDANEPAEPPPTDDPYEAAEPVPMSLLDVAVLASIEAKAREAFPGPAAPPRVPATFDPLASQPTLTAESLAFVANRSAVPGYAMFEATRALADGRLFIESLLAKSGFMGGIDPEIPLRGGKGSRVFRQEDGGFARFDLERTDAASVFRVRLYRANGSGGFAVATDLSFSRAFSGAISPLQIDAYDKPSADGSTRVSRVVVDGGAGSVDALIGTTAPTASERPHRFALRFRSLEGGAGAQLDGAYVWRPGIAYAPAASTLSPPRPFDNTDGDVERFAARAAGGQLAQRLGYLPAGLGDGDYRAHVRPFLAAIVRRRDVTPGCDSLGKVLNDAAGTTLPTSVCSDEATLTDDTLIRTLLDACQRGFDVQLTVRRGDGQTTPLFWCSKAMEMLLLESPQFLSAGGTGEPRIVLPADVTIATLAEHRPPSVAHADLLAGLDAAPPFDHAAALAAALPASATESEESLTRDLRPP